MNEKQLSVRKTIKDAKRFASDYGIIDNNLMTRVIKQNFSYWAVYASPKKEIKSFQGEWGNEIWPSWNLANSRAKQLIKQDYDTYLFPFGAFGMENCQITKYVLNSEEDYASYLVFHESFHVQSKIKKFNLKQTLEENFAEAFAFNLQQKFYEDKPTLQKRILQKDDEWNKYFQILASYLSLMRETLKNKPNKKEEVRKQIIEDAKEKALNFKNKKVIQYLTKPTCTGNFNNAFLLRASHYVPNSYGIEEKLRQINPRE